MVYYFLEGGAFMWPILLTLLFGLAFVIERAYSLMMSAVDSQTFFESVSQSIKENGTDAAVQVCSETEGPVASIFHAGLSKMSRGLDEVEKAIQNAGAIEMAFLEKNMIWLNAVITIAPMLGFTGTVVGMITVFSVVETDGGGFTSALAGGISQALITTAAGLIVAIPTLFFQRHFERRVDELLVFLAGDCERFIELLSKK